MEESRRGEDRGSRAERASREGQKAKENERAGGLGGMEAGFPGGASREPEMSSRDPGFAE